jgi:outer membrane protein assembly factor BamB
MSLTLVTSSVALLALLAVAHAVADSSEGTSYLHTVESDDEMPRNKYTDPSKGDLRRGISGLFENIDVLANNNGTCDHSLHVLWNGQVGSSIFATPTIADLHSDGRKEIFIPTYTHFVEALDGATGGDVAGFPFTHPNFRSHSSAVPIDLDADGSLEWMIATFTGELVFLSESGQAVPGKTIKMPPLPVKRDWRKKNLAASDAAKSTVNKRPAEAMFEIRKKVDAVIQQRRSRVNSRPDVMPRLSADQQSFQQAPIQDPSVDGAHQSPSPAPVTSGRSLQQFDAPMEQPLEPASPMDAPVEDDILDAERRADMMYGEDYYGDMHEDGQEYWEDGFPVPPEGPATIGTDGWLSPEAKASMDLVFHPELFRSAANVEPEHDPFSIYAMLQTSNTVVVQSDEVAVDAHILSTPIIVDTDMDGRLDVVVHVSYFFDALKYDDPSNANIIPDGVDIDDFVASAVVVLDILSGTVKWQQVLHLTTKHVAHPAYAFSSPFVANVNQGIVMDIFVTTPLGFIAGFDGNGRMLPGWPVHMAPIAGSPVSDDVNGDGKLDICAGDLNGNVACFSADGKELWHTIVAGGVTDSPMLGDVNGDSFLDIVVGTSKGGIYALDARSGKLLPRFPIVADGAVMAPPLLLNLNATEGKGLHVVVPALDGFLYVVSGTTGCYELIDLGEKSYSMVLADDLTGNGQMDLVVTTLSGGVTVFETETPFHPLKAWPRRLKSFNGATANEGRVGVFIEPESRIFRDVRGDHFKLLVNIKDDRPRTAPFRVYTLLVFAGTHIILGMRKTFDAAAVSMELPCPAQRMFTSVRVVMVTAEGLVFEDSVAMSFNMHFLETIKFLVVVPFLLTCAALWFVRKQHTVVPPKIVLRRGRLVLDDDEYYYR